MSTSRRKLRELESPESWDFDNAKKRPGVKSPRAIVSVAYSRQEFDDVAKAAQQASQKISAFIREASLEKARTQSAIVEFGPVSGGLGSLIISSGMQSITWVSSSDIARELENAPELTG